MRRMLEAWNKLLSGLLSRRRYQHSLCVAQEAKRLALRYGAEAERAYQAGLLHDICKDHTNAQLLQLFEEFDIILDAVEQTQPKLWHAIAGEGYLRHRLGITDHELLTAVRYHTTARAGMSLLEQVLYIADFTSADRDYEDVDIMRACADRSIPEAMRYALRYTIRDLAAREKPIHPDTLRAYNEIILKNCGNLTKKEGSI